MASWADRRPLQCSPKRDARQMRANVIENVEQINKNGLWPRQVGRDAYRHSIRYRQHLITMDEIVPKVTVKLDEHTRQPTSDVQGRPAFSHLVEFG